MHREPLLRQLLNHRPHDAAEDAALRRMIDFVRSHPDCFERSLTTGHITGSAWLLDASCECVLLTYHKKLRKWLQLGGHADGCADLLQVAFREAREESGLRAIVPVTEAIFDVDVHRIPAIDEVGPHDHFDVRFLCRVTEDQEIHVSDESEDMAWFTIAEVENLAVDDSVMRLCRKWRFWRDASGDPRSRGVVGA